MLFEIRFLQLKLATRISLKRPPCLTDKNSGHRLGLFRANKEVDNNHPPNDYEHIHLLYNGTAALRRFHHSHSHRDFLFASGKCKRRNETRAPRCRTRAHCCCCLFSRNGSLCPNRFGSPLTAAPRNKTGGAVCFREAWDLFAIGLTRSPRASPVFDQQLAVFAVTCGGHPVDRLGFRAGILADKEDRVG